MSQDVDAMQEEARQQRLVEDIVRSLHCATAGDAGYANTFADVAHWILWRLQGIQGRMRCGGGYDLYERHVWRRIAAFAEEEVERCYLLTKVLEKALASVIVPRDTAWHAKQKGLPLPLFPTQ